MLAQPCKSGPVLAQTVEVFRAEIGPPFFFGLSLAHLFGLAQPYNILYIIINYNIYVCIYVIYIKKNIYIKKIF